jgi:hypothetical protein
MRLAPLILAIAIGSAACGSRVDSLVPARAAPGEEFTINGTDLQNLSGPPPVAPKLQRCGEVTLEVVQWFENSVRVRVPRNVPAGVYQVYAFGRPSGAYNRPRTFNALPFWVTAAPVPLSVTDDYAVQVQSFRIRYAKSARWEAWMLANRDRYEPVFRAVHALPCPLTVSVSYQTPLAYRPPWSSEAEHMSALEAMDEPVFPGYHFAFSYGEDAGATYAHAVLGVPGNSSTNGRTMQLHYETILPHEFGHVVKVLHHYDDADLSTIGRGLHFPPGESGCVMDRNDEQYCSACRAALNVPLDADNAQASGAASSAILARYPPGW